MGETADHDLRLIVKRHGLVIDERIVDKESLTVGRDPTCDLVLEDPSTSRHVATFHVIDDEIWVEDAGSIECIRVNGESISERRALHAGDWVDAGPFRIEPAGSDVLPAATEPDPAEGSADLPASTSEGPFTVQIGAFGSEANAQKEKDRIQSKSPIPVEFRESSDSKLVLVFAGRYADPSDAARARVYLRDALGYTDCFVTRR